MWRKLLFFSMLYFVQGAALAYIVNFQKPYLSVNGVSKEALGLFTGLLLIPFIVKVALGYVSDRFPVGRWGSRKPYMVIGLTLFMVSFLAVSFVDPGQNFFAFASLVWLASLGLAWFDTCADGWAVDTSAGHEHSSVQASMIAGKSLGLVTMSALFGFLAMRSGFGIIFQLIAGLAALVLLVVLFVPSPKPVKKSGALVKGWGSLLKSYYIFFALFAVVYATASFGTDGLLTLNLTETTGASSVDVGFFGMWRGGGALLGAILFALINPRLGSKPTQFLAIFLLGLGCAIPLLGWPSTAAALVWGAIWGFQETAFVTLAMRFAEGRWAATLFAGAMIFSNIGNSLGEGLGAPLVPRIGFSGVFLMFAGVAWLSAACIPKIYKPLRD